MFKRSLIAASSIALTATLVSPAFAAPADFVGTWVNTNSNTRGITRVVVTTGANGDLYLARCYRKSTKLFFPNRNR